LSGLLCLAACSDYDRARNAYEGGDYKLAISRFEALAVKGDTKAQYDLAQIYFQGIGTEGFTEGLVLVAVSRWHGQCGRDGSTRRFV